MGASIGDYIAINLENLTFTKEPLEAIEKLRPKIKFTMILHGAYENINWCFTYRMNFEKCTGEFRHPSAVTKDGGACIRVCCAPVIQFGAHNEIRYRERERPSGALRVVL
jgi:hypothetical protein